MLNRKVAITGGTGMMGTILADALRRRGDEVFIIGRGAPKDPRQIRWNPNRGIEGVSVLDGLDTVFHLAGAPIADRPWTQSRRKILRESRIESALVLQRELAKLDRPPKHYIGVGSLGLFGDCGEQIVDDDAEHGDGFLADLSREWEEAHDNATSLGCRVAVLRMSIVLSPTGGAFPLMVKPFRLGIGGWLGNGKQYTSWISVRDAISALIFLMDNDSAVGGFNGTAPESCRNKFWFKALGRVLNRPVLTHAPKWALRGALGDLADELFLASIRPVPRKLLQAGFKFQDYDIEDTFHWLVSELDGNGPLMQLQPTTRRR